MIKIVKKQESSQLQSNLIRVAMIFGALVAAGIIIWIIGYNPIEVYSNIIKGSVTNEYRLNQTINKAIPLIILSLGVAVAFKMKFWNIGAEGQLYMGATAATFVVMNFPELPGYIILPLMAIASIVAGGLYALIPAFIKAKLGTNETLITLMMNYIAIKFVSYLRIGPWRSPEANGYPKIANFPDHALLPKVGGIHIGWIIAIVLTILVYILLKYTKLGYEISVLGENAQTAKYAGMNISKIMIVTVVLSGGMIGLVGMIQATGIEKTLTDTLSQGFGFTAIIVAWLAKLSAPVIVVASFLFSMLLQGGTYIQASLQVPASVADVIQGLILFFVLASEFFINYKFVYAKKIKKIASKEVK